MLKPNAPDLFENLTYFPISGYDDFLFYNQQHHISCNIGSLPDWKTISVKPLWLSNHQTMLRGTDAVVQQVKANINFPKHAECYCFKIPVASETLVFTFNSSEASLFANWWSLSKQNPVLSCVFIAFNLLWILRQETCLSVLLWCFSCTCFRL